MYPMDANIQRKFQSIPGPTMDDAEPAIAIVPYGMRPDAEFATCALSQLDWPLGKPDRLVGGTINDLRASDHLVFYPSSSLWLTRLRSLKAQVSLMIVEPAAIHRRHMRLARLFHRRFTHILTCNPKLLATAPNAVFLAFGTSWVPEWRDLALTKHEDISLIASNKRDLEGHKLRHTMAHWAKKNAPEVHLLGRAFEPFDKKSDGLAPYRYSVVIENVREPGYFTEKLIDALLCKTVPIYWGAPDIAKYFDTDGMIICEKLADLKAAIAAATAENYETRKTALAANQAKAAEFVDLHQRAANTIANAQGIDR